MRPVTDPDFLHNRRIGYDLTAAAYADRFHGHLDDRPLDQAMLAGFAGQVGSMTALDFDEGRFEAVCA